ncbi:glycosyltransferase family 4 protein [Cyclobacterium marinum]|uniref:glycosyltransferase family 4 protein n=1 Tax=Cyclobacterium marinum TaxID=104 RepID=UPI0018DBDAA3|nr:glycosyltransferase family 4 protein [Cyclobacterium marinum]MBI0399420.1 glycosyltransferase family 4 protein [Cyclobacterium marinum]
MRIIYIHQYYLTPEQGGAIRSYHLSQGLTKVGVKVELITAHNKNQYIRRKDGEVIVHYLPVPYLSTYSTRQRVMAFYDFYKKAKRLIKELAKPDLFYISSTPLTTGWIGVWAKKKYGIPYVFEVRDLWPEAPVQVLKINNPFIRKFLYKMEAGIYREADKIVALSPGIQHYIKDLFPDKKIALIPNFSNNEFFNPNQKKWNGRDFDKQPLRISYAGAIGKVNGLDNFLELAFVAQSLGKKWRFELMGSGNALSELKMKVSSLKLSNVIFVPFGDKNAVKAQLDKADFAYISFLPLKVLENSSPNKFFDALAMGLPVIVNFKGWIYNLIEIEKIGLFHPVEDHELLVENIEHLRKNLDQYYQMSRNSRRIAETKFDKNFIQEKLHAFLGLKK